MRSADNIKDLIKNTKIETNPQTNEAVLNDLLGRMDDAEGVSINTLQRNIWRIIMKSNITKSAAAAIILIGAFIFLTTNGTSIALADVAKKIEQMQNCAFEKTMTVFSKEDNVKPLRVHKSAAYYINGAYREDVYCDEKVVKQVYVNFSEGTLVAIGHEMMLFDERKLTKEDITELAPIGPNNFVSEILSKGDYKKLGRKRIDGVLSDGFEFHDKRTLLSMDKEKTKNITIRLWANVNTKLPVRIEADAIYNGLQVNTVQYNPKWNIELEPGFFEMKIPDSYVRLHERGLIGLNLENWPMVKVEPGMAAEKAGIKDGDFVLKIDGNSIEHIKSSAAAQNRLLGKAGEKVTLTVKRGEEIITFEITREPLPK